MKTGREEVVAKEVNGRNPRLKDMADKLAEFFCNPQLCKDDYADVFLMYLGKFVAFCIFSSILNFLCKPKLSYIFLAKQYRPKTALTSLKVRISMLGYPRARSGATRTRTRSPASSSIVVCGTCSRPSDKGDPDTPRGT